MIDVELTPAQKAARTRRRNATAQKALSTARWARIMAKWLITHSTKGGVKWRLVDFNGARGQESYGIVDLIAIRKKHSKPTDGFKRGDIFEIVLIQVKGGTAPFPTADDTQRLLAARPHHNDDKVVLVEWRRGTRLNCYELPDTETPVPPSKIFGKLSKSLKPPSIAAVGAAAE